MSMYSFHGRGTLNGTDRIRAGAALRATARGERIRCQRSAPSARLTDSSYSSSSRARASIDTRIPQPHTHSSLELWDLPIWKPLACSSSRQPADRPRTSGALDRTLQPMNHYLGIDIGTFESKGVLVDAAGRIVASAAKPHKMIVPQRAGLSTEPSRTGGTTSSISAAGSLPIAAFSRRPSEPWAVVRSGRACCPWTPRASR
jgi:hypothetical protein